jgi:magnesium transporter
MVRIYYHKNEAIEKADGLDVLNQISREQLLWVDLQFPTIQEQQQIELLFNINFTEQAEESGLESNVRFYETGRFIYINSNFTSKQENYYENCPIIFYVIDGILITKRNIDLSSFAETVKKIKRNQKAFSNGNEILEGILETEVDLDSDYLEYISKEIAQLGKNLSKDNLDEENVLLKINQYQESTLFLREGFVDKQRVVSSLIKSHSFTSTPRLKILVKDINSML